MDSRFSFLAPAQAELLIAVLTRRNSPLLKRIAGSDALTWTDADAIVTTLGEEFTNNLDDEFEPTAYGREVSAVLARFNAARIEEWP